MKQADDVGLNDRARRGEINPIGGEVFTLGDSGIVDKNVEFGELFPDAGCERIDGARIFNVELHAVHAGVGGGDFVEQSLAAAGDDDPVAAFMENLGKCTTDTAGPASDEHGVASWTHSRLRTPGDYSEKPAEALVMFCGRYLEILLYEGSIRMIRVSMAETERFHEPAAQYFDVLFTQVHARLSAYLKTAFGLSVRASAEAAHRLLGQVLYPGFPRALFGMDQLAESFDREALAPDFDLKPIRKAVAELIESVQKH